VKTCGDNDWVAISALVPGRTKKKTTMLEQMEMHRLETRLHDATDLTLPIPNGRHDLHDVVRETSVHDHLVFKLLPNFTFPPHPNSPVLNILNGHSEPLLEDDIEAASVPSLSRDDECRNSILSPPISVSSTFPRQWIE
jgi:hypothetical protein